MQLDAFPPILDACCGGRMFHFDKSNPRVLYADIRAESHVLCDGRGFEVSPDVIADFREMPFPDGAFSVVVFDPPHIERAGPKSYQATKYGKLSAAWRDDLRAGFAECFRVLRPHGVLVFKWNEVQIPLSQILPLALPQTPVVGHKTGRQAKTHWCLFVKEDTAPELAVWVIERLEDVKK